jgi:hypothetical protein
VPLERSGVPPEGGWADCLVSRWGHQGRGPDRWAVSYLKRVLGSFVLCFFRKKVGFRWLFRGPLWLSLTTLAIFIGGEKAVVAWLAPIFAHICEATRASGRIFNYLPP